MRIFHISLAYTKGISGGDRCLLETIRYFAGQEISNVVITTDRARETYRQLGLIESSRVQYDVVPAFGGTGGVFNILQAYFRRVLRARRLVANLSVEPDDVVICHSDFFPNSWITRVFIRRCRSVKKIYWVHMIAPKLTRGYLGEFTNTFHWPTLRLIRYRLEQWFYRQTVFEDGTVLSNNPFYREILQKWFPKNRIHILSHYSGVEVPQLDVEKKYDLVWCGRFHAQKGLPELVDIVARLKLKKSDIKLVLIGSGDSALERKLNQMIAARKLTENIIRTGYLEGDEKFRVMQQARVFVMPSWFESFGQVNLEAMKCGLPVVAYDLPVFAVFKKGMVKVPVRDNEKMTTEILRFLTDPQAYDELRQDALSFSSDFSWDKTGEETLRHLVR